MSFLKLPFIRQSIDHKGNTKLWGNLLFFVSRTEMRTNKKDGTLKSRYPVVYAFHITPLTAIGITIMRTDK